MRAESWKAIRIPESTRAWRSWHAPIMPDSTTVATVFPPAASAASRTFSCLFSPTRFHEDPHLILQVRHLRRCPSERQTLSARVILRIANNVPHPRHVRPTPKVDLRLLGSTRIEREVSDLASVNLRMPHSRHFE